MTTILMAAGTLADRDGRKRLFLTGIVAFAATSLVCGLTASAPVLIAARFLQGLSAALMLICQVAILSSQFRARRERGRAFAWWGIIFGIGLGFGPIIGSAILTLANWRWVFLVHVVLADVTLFLARAGVRESRDPHALSPDLAGIISLSAVSLAGIGLGLTNTPVSNTITAAVRSERAGMASGVDMSARMTSLAFNIALIGFILVEDAMSSLRDTLKMQDGAGLRLFAEKIIAAADPTAQAALLAQSTVPGDAVHAALASGFGWVMSYGAGSAFLLSLGSLILFAPGRTARHPGCPRPCEQA
ncbi:hypothetical protein GCM10027202_31140 [Microvirgula curvata]